MRLAPLFSLRKIFQQTFSRRRSRRGGTNRRKSSARLQLEALEDRWLPSTGVLTLSVGGDYDRAFASFVDDNANIVLAGGARASGEAENFMVARYQSDGILDSSFGDGGVTVSDLYKDFDERALAAVSYLDGKTIAAGTVQGKWNGPGGDFNNDFAVVRYLADGSPDPNFGEGKGNSVPKATADFGGNERLYGAVVLPDGSIVAAGSSNASGAYHFALAKFTASGQLDTSFGTGGVVQTVLGNWSEIHALTLHDGKILAVGQTSSDSTDEDVALAQYDFDGSLDPNFGTGGIVVNNFSPVTSPNLAGSDWANAVAIDANNNILLAGYSAVDHIGDGVGDALVTRFMPNGTLDITFGAGGSVQLLLYGSGGNNTSTQLTSIAVQGDGNIVVTGQPWESYLPDSYEIAYEPEFQVARLDPNGQLDPSFDSDGRVATPILDFANARSIITQSDGKIVVSGYAMIDPLGPNWKTVVALARYNPDGSLDTTFGEPPPPSPGITVTPTSGLQTSEDGGTASFTVVLNAAPAPGTTVTIFITSLDLTEGTVSENQLVFTSENWNVPQTVIITGVDDNEKDGDQSYSIELTAESTDADYVGIDPADVIVLNKDNEKGGRRK